ncbi:hypothetical protein F4859DRAFT_500040 [Xylaria cf. heliscus]|nr:hypothetical protein F4859DRAFT_500040 [Xylaria cf. heliscus]
MPILGMVWRGLASAPSTSTVSGTVDSNRNPSRNDTRVRRPWINCTLHGHAQHMSRRGKCKWPRVYSRTTWRPYSRCAQPFQTAVEQAGFSNQSHKLRTHTQTQRVCFCPDDYDSRSGW